MKQISTMIIAICALFYTSIGMTEGTMTNDDIIKFVQAGIGSDIILSVIDEADETEFDISTDALIDLKVAGVPEAVIHKMIAPNPGSTTATKETDPNPDEINPETVISVDNGVKTLMRYLTPQQRSGTRAFGFGGIASYAVLRGPTAKLRLGNQPSFQIATPKNSQVEGYFTLVKLAQRKNNTREILTGGGYMGISTGLPQDRVINVTSEPLADQSGAPKDFIIYTASPLKALKKGEYSIVVASGEASNLGFFSSAGGLDTFFDFGVD